MQVNPQDKGESERLAFDPSHYAPSQYDPKKTSAPQAVDEEHGISIDEASQSFIATLLSSQKETTAVRLFVESGGTPSAETFLSYHPLEEHKIEEPRIHFRRFVLHLSAKDLQFLQETSITFDAEGQSLKLVSPKAKIPRGKASLRRIGTHHKAKASAQGKKVPDASAIEIPKDAKVELIYQNPVSITLAYAGNWIHLTRSETQKAFDDIEFKAVGEDCPMPLSEDFVRTCLQSCYDPEIPVNIIDLGLVYDIQILPKSEEHRYNVEIEMTLTAPGCPMADVIVSEVKTTLESIACVDGAKVRLTFSPPWSQDQMSEAGRLELGLF